MKRIFKTKAFSRWMRKNNLSDDTLRLAVTEMDDGLIDADLGRGVVKKRVAIPGHGKRGEPEQSLLLILGIAGFFCLPLQRMSERIFLEWS